MTKEVKDVLARWNKIDDELCALTNELRALITKGLYSDRDECSDLFWFRDGSNHLSRELAKYLNYARLLIEEEE